MSCWLAFLPVVALLGRGETAEQKAPSVLPAFVYRDYVFTHYLDTTRRQRPYVISVQPLNHSGVKISFDRGGPRNNFESLFVRGSVLVVGANVFIPSRGGADGDTRSDDTVSYVSPDRLCDAKWLHVEPDGKPVKYPDAGNHVYPVMWGRRSEFPPLNSDLAPGATEIVHTAVAAAGDRDLLVFDLVRTVPARDKPAPTPKIAVTRLVPEERARVTGFGIGSWGQPEVKAAGELMSVFSEPFQAYLLGDDYYFVTKSGSVFRSLPPTKGAARTMSAVWDKPKSPVRFIISDGNRTGVHLLVTAREQGGWEYFRLGPDPKPQVLSDVDFGDDETPPEVVYKLAVLLREKKEIVTPK